MAFSSMAHVQRLEGTGTLIYFDQVERTTLVSQTTRTSKPTRFHVKV